MMGEVFVGHTYLLAKLVVTVSSGPSDPLNKTSPPLCHTDSIPADLKDPFYTDQYEQEHLKPPVASLLLSADLYCRAGSLILKSDAAKPLLGHDAVIQALAQRGLYVTDQERLVTERDLRKRPLQMVRDTFTEEMRPTEGILVRLCYNNLTKINEYLQ